MKSEKDLLKTALLETLLEVEKLPLHKQGNGAFDSIISKKIDKNPKLAQIMQSATPEFLMTLMTEIGIELGLEDEDFEDSDPMIIPSKEVRYHWPDEDEWTKFTKDMKKNAHKTGKECLFHPYRGNTISYASMNEKQLRWYFCWRTQMRQDNPLPNQVPYLILYTVESLHIVGSSSAAEAVEPLFQLLENYGDEDDQFEGFLLSSIFDFCMYHQFSFHPLLAVPSITPANPLHIEYLISVVAKLESSELFTFLPYMVELLSEFPREKTRLHHAEQLAELDKDDCADMLFTITALAIEHLHEWLVDNEEIGFFDKYATIEEELISFHLFPNIRSLEDKNFEVSMCRYSQDKTLCHTVTELVRLCENVLRECFGVRGRLRQIDLAPEIQSLVTNLIVERFDYVNDAEIEELPNNVIPFPKQ